MADVRGILREGDAAVTTANLCESLDVAKRTYGLPIAQVTDLLEPLFAGSLTTLDLTLRVARRAAEIHSTHYHRSRRPISLADAVLIASAGPEDRIATADPHILAVTSSGGLATIALPTQG